MYDILELNNKLVDELKNIAKELEVKGFDKLKKQDLVYQILDQQAVTPSEAEPVKVKKEAKKTKAKPAEPVENKEVSTEPTQDEEVPKKPRKRSEVLKELGRAETAPTKKEKREAQNNQ